MYKGMLHTHLLAVILFLVIYIIKTFLLLTNKTETLQRVTKMVKVPEMIISTLFLGTGTYLFINSGTIDTFIYIKLAAVLISIPLAIIGFKKANKLLAVISLVLLFGAYGLAEMHSKRVKKGSAAAPVEVSETASAQDLYIQNCAACHGDKGDAGLSGASDLTTSSSDLISKIETISNGRGVMPAFAGRLSDDQVHAVAEYIETMKK